MKKIKFPDIEILIVAFLKNRFNDLHIATKRPDPENNLTAFVVVNGGYGATLDVVRREASIVIEVFHKDELIASELALTIAAEMQTIAGDQIKFIELDLGPVRIIEQAEFEKRAATFNLIVKGSEI